MKLKNITDWLDKTLNVAAFDDVSNNGLQIERSEVRGQRSEVKGQRPEVTTVAFAVDASVRAVEAAAKAGAQLLVVHHGISWGGGVKRISGGVGRVIRAAIENNVALYACHLPLDAHPTLGNNAQLAKLLGLRRVKPAFNYHGNVIGLTGKSSIRQIVESSKREKRKPEGKLLQKTCDLLFRQFDDSDDSTILTLGLCSGGAGEFAEEAKNLGCDLYVTGEASWGDVIAAENCGMRMLCLGHYETEVFGVRAVAAATKRALKLKTVDLTESLRR